MPTAILIVAAGKGERAGLSQPKQYAALLGRPMLRRAIEAFAGRPDSFVQVMIGPGQEEEYAAAVAGLDLPAPAVGGATRQESVRRGLEALSTAAPEPKGVLRLASPCRRRSARGSCRL